MHDPDQHAENAGFQPCPQHQYHKESMAQSHEKAVPSVSSGLISLGEEVTWCAWHFGVPLHMSIGITQMVAPAYFVDEQL